MILRSSAILNNQAIPGQYTRGGKNLSPPLDWSEIPYGCQSFTLMCEDRDARGFVHWLLYNISPNVSALPEGLPKTEMLVVPIIARQGINSFGNVGYDGPFPPVGSGLHNYVFTLFALDKELEVPIRADREAIMDSMQRKVLTSATLTGTFERFPSMENAGPV